VVLRYFGLALKGGGLELPHREDSNVKFLRQVLALVYRTKRGTAIAYFEFIYIASRYFEPARSTFWWGSRLGLLSISICRHCG